MWFSLWLDSTSPQHASLWPESRPQYGLILLLSTAYFFPSVGLTLSSLGPALGPHWALSLVLSTV